MAQAAGNECDFDEEGTLHVKTRILEEKSNLAKMSIPDPQKDDPLPFVLEVCERIGSALNNEAAVRGVVSLPWTVAVQMRGMEQLIYDTVDDPDFVHAVMRFCTDYTKMLGTSVVEAIGEGGV
jgi:uroporphyrinogen-III decarboxylase